MNKKANILTVVVFVGLIACLSTLFLIKKAETFSEQENRTLQTLPELTWDSFAEGKYSEEINTYFADQFPLRDVFVGIKGYSELAMLKRENNDVLLGEDGFLAVRGFSIYEGIDYFQEDLVAARLSAVKKLQTTVEAQEAQFAIIIPPRIIDVAPSKFDYPMENSERLQSFIREHLKDVNYIDILPLLKEKLEADEYVYYKTDHHYTSLGAYYTYCEVMKQYGMEADILPLSDFDVELASDCFYGTTWSKAGFKFVEPDRISFFHYKNGDENDYTTVNYYKTFSGLYDSTFLETKDKYSAFIGGNSTLTTITKTNGENAGERPKLLLAKDSFGLSLAPFLALHFDLEIVNVAGTMNISKIAAEKNCDYVLIVYNTENLVTGRDLAFVK